MKYEVLARRYRPRRFEEVVGQEAVAETLRGGISQERVAHAYLFTGPRGVGKTSMARIFAKALNCQRAAEASPSDPDWAVKVEALPCNECSTCEGIHVGQDIDVVEMDGASHRGIEDVRAIVESVNRPATRSPYKIFIIDEVHMLTREAFNALLKTLEEPPAHVKFIFATTEAHRIPDTVLSRCQRFDFHPIGEEAIERRLQQILSSEHREAEEGLLAKIARYGRGGLRDAQTLLDQMLTFSEGVLHADDLERITGRVPTEMVRALCDAVLGGDERGVLRGLQSCSEKGADPAVLLEQVIESLRDEVHRAVDRDSGSSGDRGAGDASLDRLLGTMQILLEAASKLRHSAFPVIAVEVVLLKASRLEEPRVLEEVLQKLVELEAGTPPDSAPFGPQRTGRRDPSAPAPPSRTADAGGGAPSGAVPPQDARPAPAASDPRGGSSARSDPSAGPGADPPAALRQSSSPAARPDGCEGVSDASGAGLPPRGSPPRGSPPHDASGETRAVRESAGGAEYSMERLLGLWNQIGIELQEKQPHIAPLIGDARPTLHPERKDTARLIFEDDFFLARMKSPQTRRAFETLVADVTGEAWKFDLQRSTDRPKRNGGAPGPAVRGEAPGDVSGRSAVASGPPPPPGAAPSIARSEVFEKARKLFNGRIV